MKKIFGIIAIISVLCGTSFGRNYTTAILEDMAVTTVTVGNLTATGAVTAANLTTTTTSVSGNFAIATNLVVTGSVTAASAVLSGALTAPVTTVSNLTATTRVLTSADFGKLVIVNTNAAVAITLPANASTAGAWIMVAIHGSASDDCAPTIAAATADTLIGPNDVDLKSVTWGSAQRIGAQAKFWCDGTVWHVQNLGGTTMTYND